LSTIILKLNIKAPPPVCFDLARNIDVHEASTAQTGEQAIAGVTTGLISLGESVTWRAKHFGIWQTLSSKITEFDYPKRFVDEMVSGAFRHFRHEHTFEAVGSGTLMTDIFEYSVPYGLAGSIFDKLVLKRYMTRLLVQRNAVIRAYAEADQASLPQG
jgi:ligand-binding SRPBCC domain-containing protein